MLHSNDQALQGFKQSFSYATDATLKAVVRGNVIMGSEKHKVDGSVLTVQAALLEALENVIGQPEAMITGPRRQYCMWLLKVDGKDGPAWYLFNWSNTRIKEKQWFDPQTEMGIFDQKPKMDANEKAHAASVFNAGMKYEPRRPICSLNAPTPPRAAAQAPV